MNIFFELLDFILTLADLVVQLLDFLLFFLDLRFQFLLSGIRLIRFCTFVMTSSLSKPPISVVLNNSS